MTAYTYHLSKVTLVSPTSDKRSGRKFVHEKLLQKDARTDKVTINCKKGKKIISNIEEIPSKKRLKIAQNCKKILYGQTDGWMR